MTGFLPLCKDTTLWDVDETSVELMGCLCSCAHSDEPDWDSDYTDDEDGGQQGEKSWWDYFLGVFCVIA